MNKQTKEDSDIKRELLKIELENLKKDIRNYSIFFKRKKSEGENNGIKE